MEASRIADFANQLLLYMHNNPSNFCMMVDGSLSFSQHVNSIHQVRNIKAIIKELSRKIIMRITSDILPSIVSTKQNY